MNKEDKYIMAFCSVEMKVTAHKIYWDMELQGLKVRYYPRIYCGHCQFGLIDSYTKAGIFA